MFCQLDRLRRCLSPRIRQALNELPETLDETYERTLLDIDKENWEYAHRLFQCIVVARRPLRVEELAEFLAFKSETGGCLTFQGDLRPEDARDTVLSTCSSLISIVTVDDSPVMQFSHFSVKEYLTSSRIAGGRVSRYHIPLEQAHLFVTQACLSFLLQLDKHVTIQSIEEFPLALYAGQYWTEHAGSGDVAPHTEDLIKRLFKPENHHFAIWVWIYDTLGGQSMDPESPPLPKHALLHYAARHGFHQVVEWLITTCSQDVNVACLHGWTPFHFAARYGQVMTVEVLLMHHADTNARDGHMWTALHHASCGGHSKVAQLLLEHGADINSKNKLGITPLCLLLMYRANLETAQLLLEHGADPCIRGDNGCDSLYMALEQGHQGLVQLLLKHGADPNNRDEDGQAPLHVACRNGHKVVVQGLLELGVDVNSRDNEDRTPLQITLENGKKEIEQLLLQHGAEGS